MPKWIRFFAGLLCLALALAAAGQQPAAPQSPNPQDAPLGDIARRLRANKRPEIKISDQDASRLFASIDEILDFVSRDSGLPKRAAVKHKLVSRDDVEKHVSDSLDQSAEAQRVLQSELVMKKFGLFPPDFNLRNFLVQDAGRQVAGYYDFRTKTMCLLNWIDWEAQLPIMAHELTHALQDQNYNLRSWQLVSGAAGDRSSKRVDFDGDDGELRSARRAAVEGQAMLVLYDYRLKSAGINLSELPDAIDVLRNRIDGAYDVPVVFHDAPLVMKESAAFPYLDGFNFELALLKKGGRKLAFAGVFARPPRNSHDILHPDAYLAAEKRSAGALPDLQSVLQGSYEIYDSGSVGELDVRIMAREFGRDNDVYTVAPNWDGGAYMAFKRTSAGQQQPKSPADISLVYISRWKSTAAALRFAQLYRNALVKRTAGTSVDSSQPKCAGGSRGCGPLWGARVQTAAEPVSIEVWPGDILFVAHGFDEPAVSNLRNVLLNQPRRMAWGGGPELNAKLWSLNGFRKFQESARRQLLGLPSALTP